MSVISSSAALPDPGWAIEGRHLLRPTAPLHPVHADVRTGNRVHALMPLWEIENLDDPLVPGERQRQEEA